MFLTSFSIVRSARTKPAIPQDDGSGDDGFVRILRTNEKIWWLLPLFLFSGVNIGLIYGCLPGLIPTRTIPIVFIFLALAEIVGSLGAGKVCLPCQPPASVL
eukprot:COSAG01_NODE_5447_length_4258_cov_13.569127_4_plen_102_part_00